MTTFDPPEIGYAGYIFDCDGTLVDSMPLHYESWLVALDEHHAGISFTWDLFVSRAGMSLESTVVELNAQFSRNLDPVRVAGAQRAHFDRSMHALEPIQDVVSFARRVAGEAAVSIASGNTCKNVVATLELLGLRELFPIIVTPADVARGKPAPDLFLCAAERMGVAPSSCVVFEDSPLGIEAARRAGMSSVLVRSTAPLVVDAERAIPFGRAESP